MSSLYNQAVLVSARQDLIIFFRKNIEPHIPIKIVDMLNNDVVSLYPLILFDMTLVKKREKIAVGLSDIKNSLEKFVFIADNQISREFISRLFNYTKQVLPYPCNPRIVYNYIQNLLKNHSLIANQSINHNQITNLLSPETEDESQIISKLLGISAHAQNLKDKIIRYANQDGPVLLLGESGTGKTTTARVIHDLSKRKHCSFVPVSCANFTNGLIDSALFGTVDGAFTDARDKKGYIRKAEGGTLFLDEIGKAPFELQAKLNMFLDSGLVYSVGSDEAEKIDTRMIFATNQDLNRKIQDNTFREDFYYRIYKNVIVLPPLRDRREDISVIANLIADKNGKYIPPEIMRILEEYNWPGNIRQLINCIERACIINNGEVIKEENIFFGI